LAGMLGAHLRRANLAAKQHLTRLGAHGTITAALDALVSAESMGRNYNAHIKGAGSDGPFDCRTHRLPSY
jgi:hypothetical protein